MPSKEQMKLVGETCSEYERETEAVERSCESCIHWVDEELCVNSTYSRNN